MNGKNKLPFGKKNYTIMIIGLAVLILGFVTMTLDSEKFGFGFLGLTLGPIMVMIGFIIEIYAVLYTPRHKDEN